MRTIVLALTLALCGCASQPKPAAPASLPTSEGTGVPEGVPEMIVVGVSAGTHAVREFSPPGSTPEARGAEYVDFLTRELKPFIDTRYRTKPGPSSTCIVGQGQSAVLALYAAWTHGDTFAGAIALDFPDVDMQMLSWIQEAPASGRPWVWLEQTWSERARRSTTGITAALQRHSDTQVAVTSAEMHRSARVLAALRAMPVR